MPLVYQQNINGTAKLAIWHITESEDFFFSHVSLVQPINHAHKRLQHLAGRFLLKHLDPSFPSEQILISPTNKPYLLSDEFHFSISHCGDYAAVIMSKKDKAGIDIELITDKILRVSKKFMNEDEKNIGINLSDLQKATMIWSAKESVFKWFGTGSVDFKNHIHINHISVNQDKFEMQVFFTKAERISLNIHGTFLNNLCIAWVCA